jgi:hypothetical protein
MKIEVIYRKLNYYVRWYQSMTLAERQSVVGLWVRDNITLYTDTAIDFERSLPRSTKGGGNYTSQFFTSNNN